MFIKPRTFALGALLLSTLIAGGVVGHEATASVGLVSLKTTDFEHALPRLKQAGIHGDLKVAARIEDRVLVYVSPEGIRLLEDNGVGFSALEGDVEKLEIYIVGKRQDVDINWLENLATVIDEGDNHWLIAVEPEDALEVHMLQSKKRLPRPSQPGLPMERAPQIIPKAAAEPLSYDPMIQAMVDSVSSGRLYSNLSELSGETQVLVGGEAYTIYTRYSPTDLCRKAGQYILEQFEAMGIDAEYDYFYFQSVLEAVDFPAGSLKGWAVGRGETIIHTDDGGQLWSEQECPVTQYLKDVFMLSDSHGFIVSTRGKILETDDGETWVSLASPTTEHLNSVLFADSLTGYCCGDNGTILRSVDGGETWTQLASGTTNELNGICFVDPDVGWAVGTGGLILKTEDGGDTWNSVTSPVTVNLTEVEFKSENKGWISGFSGTILRTLDGGTWQEMSTPTSKDLYSVCFIDEWVGYACGVAGAFIKTTNGGGAWTDMAAPGVNFRGLCFVDADEGWMVGPGNVIHTADGGSSWENQTYNLEAGDVNVVATIPGTTRPEEIYIICGHYDSISQIPESYAPGADDNGTGTVAVIEAARVLGDYAFEATLKFICFSREEQGLIGSAEYVEEAHARGDLIMGALNFDMIGYVDISPENVEILYDGVSSWLANQYEAAATLYVPDLLVNKNYSPGASGSDHASFWDYGYPAFCGIEDSPLNNPNYHRTSDRVQTVDFDFYTDVVKGAVAALAKLAGVDTLSSSVVQVVEPKRLGVSPNPTWGDASIEMSAHGSSAEAFQVFDVNGRLVKRIRPSLDGDILRAVWHGEDATDSMVSPGIYFVRSSQTESMTKIILLR